MTFTSTWNRSVQPRKQRKYRYNAPLHVKQKFVRAHLSPALRKKHGMRSVRVRSGDTVKIVRGTYRGKEGKVDRVNVNQGRIFVQGIEVIKKEGAKSLSPLAPSNVMVVNLQLTDAKRKRRFKTEKAEKPAEKKETKTQESAGGSNEKSS